MVFKAPVFTIAEGYNNQALARLHLYLPVHALMQPLGERMAHTTEELLSVDQSACHALILYLCQPFSLNSLLD